MKHKRTAKKIGEDRNLLVNVSYETHQTIKTQAKAQGTYLGVFCRKIFEDYARMLSTPSALRDVGIVLTSNPPIVTNTTGCSMATDIAQTAIASNTVNA